MTTKNIPIYILYNTDNLLVKYKYLLDDLFLVFPYAIKYTQKDDEKIDRKWCSRYIKIHEDYLIINLETSKLIFKIIDFKTRKDLKLYSSHINKGSQLVLDNFTTDLGIKVAETIMGLYSEDNLESNQIVNFSVHRDFIYFRVYRFKIAVSTTNNKKTKPLFKELGPQISLRLWKYSEVVKGEEKICKFEKYIKNAKIL